MRTIQEPLITCWWTIPKLATFVKINLKVVRTMAKAIHNNAKAGSKEHTIASNTISLINEPWIVADVAFLSGLSKLFVNRFMSFFQGSDPNIGTPGYLSHHRLVAYFLMIVTLDSIQSNWELLADFEEAKDFTNTIQDVEDQQLKRKGYMKFVSKMIAQVHKHNKQYLVSTHMLCAIFAEQPLGTMVAKMLHSGKLND